MTYIQARTAIFAHLEDNGWTVKKDLKIPHATTPDGRFRLWFKSQAVHYTAAPYGAAHVGRDARTVSYSLDIRTIHPVQFLDWITRTFLS